ncbi:MAG TPA: MazG nucleotide pyrophosphohydrolase domain-containing protein [Opitutaceae bacterium]
MDLAALTERAQEIRALCARCAPAPGGRPWTREALAQGLIGNANELLQLAMAKAGGRAGPELEAQLARELADCLWSVLVLADAYGVDLERAFLRAMNALEAGAVPKGAGGGERGREFSDPVGQISG